MEMKRLGRGIRKYGCQRRVDDACEGRCTHWSKSSLENRHPELSRSAASDLSPEPTCAINYSHHRQYHPAHKLLLPYLTNRRGPDVEMMFGRFCAPIETRGQSWLSHTVDEPVQSVLR